MIRETLDKDKIFHQVLKEFLNEMKSFSNLDIIPTRVFSHIISPALTNICNKYMSGNTVYYSFAMDRASHDKSTGRIEVDIIIHIKDMDDWYFKPYKINVRFGGKSE